MNQQKSNLTVQYHQDYCAVTFSAMASPCEILIASNDKALNQEIAHISIAEVQRIETKLSRYTHHNICHAINNAKGAAVAIDEEIYRLLTFAHTCYELSEGMFDLTSGVLRRVWSFDGSDRLPCQEDIDALLPLIGWSKVIFDQHTIQMPTNMEIDFGGIGKEYAVSRVADLCRQVAADISILINLGGDIQITQPRAQRQPWLIGIENDTEIIPIIEGALATSGDAKRYLLKDGIRYSHILNPKNGWPMMNAPASITTYAPLCIQAGCLATIALLQGQDAEQFLQAQDVQFWCSRS